MRITCPYCGERGLDEFVYLGDAGPARPDAGLPDPDPAATAAAFHAYGYQRVNTAGQQAELWFHASGCHAWLVLARDTLTHDIHAVSLARDVALARSGASGEEPPA
ncbi:MAG: sarcosine oxidase subunit delta [Hyphomicrobiaceae bacterium]|nr:sarcosine oxidase subunit delta [Hyphomicrobiaceae bacterium]